MFHAPASEHKQQTGPARNQHTAQREQGLSPHVTATPGYSWSGSHHSRAQEQFAHIHSTYGNQAVLRMISHSTPAIQAKLTVNQPGDAFEQEADRVANQVMRMTAPGMVQRSSTCQNEGKLQRKCAECEEEKKTGLQRKEASRGPQFAPRSVHDVLNSPGHPLDSGARAFMEPRFGYDFSQVRVHHDQSASESARDVNALAYTVGKHTVFSAGQYVPGSSSGQKLIAHELVHVIQQSGSQPSVLARQQADEQDTSTTTATPMDAGLPGGVSTSPTPDDSAQGASVASQLGGNPCLAKCEKKFNECLHPPAWQFWKIPDPNQCLAERQACQRECQVHTAGCGEGLCEGPNCRACCSFFCSNHLSECLSLCDPYR
jgi:hypothetical protein